MLKNGSTGDEVEAVQRKLIAKGINPGPFDGIFGPRTDEAVRKFQEQQGLAADGIVGPATLAALGLAEADASSADASPSDAGGADPV